jgi:hypothetical protein
MFHFYIPEGICFAALVADSEITPQAIWPNVKLLIKRDGPRAPPLSMSSLRKSQGNCRLLGRAFTTHDLCEGKHKRQAAARVQDLEDLDFDHPWNN